MNLAYPFNPISGHGLGVSYSSFTQIAAGLPSRDFGLFKIQSFVNVNTGNLTLFDHKLILQDKNFPVELFYVYNSHASTVSGIWRLAHKYFKTLPTSQNSPAILIEADGHETTYQFDSKTNRWLPPYWSDSRPYLSRDAVTKQWVWFDQKTQITEIYNEKGYLIKRLDSKNEATIYRYDSWQTPGRLNSIETPNNSYEIRRRQLANGGYQDSIYSVKSGEATLLKFSTFDIDDRLIRTTVALKIQDRRNWPFVEYKYLTPPKSKATLSDKDVYTLAYLDKIVESDGSGLFFSYGITQEGIPRPIISFNEQTSSDMGSLSTNFLYGQGNTIIQNNVQVSTKLYFNLQGSMTQIDREQGYPLVPNNLPVDSCYYIYDVNGQLSGITSAARGKQSFHYNENGRLIKQLDANGQVKEYCYDQTSPRCNLIAQLSYNNNKTQITRYVYDQAYGDSGKGLYLRFEISPEGRVTEHRDGDPNFIQYTILYVDGRFPIDNYPENTVPSLAEMASWVAQQDPQRVSLSKRLYDTSGQLSHTYLYGTVDAKGQGISDDRMSQLDTSYTILGDLHFSIETRDRGESTLHTTQEFDNLRRLISFNNAAREQTYYLYGNRHIEITRPNNRKEITELDTHGWIVKEQQTIQVNDQPITRETTYSRNIAGCTTEKCTTADGQSSYRFYDKQNRLGFIVHPSGCITEYRYNVQNRYKATIRYAKAIDKQQLASIPTQGTEPSANDLLTLMAKMSISDPAHDRISYEFYDASERLCYQVDEEACLTENIYDDHNQLIVTIQHETLQAGQLAALLKGKKVVFSVDPERDRTHHIFYDADKNKMGTQDAAGYVTEYKRNAASWITETIRYGKKQTVSIYTQNFDKIRPNASSVDAHEYCFYDPRGWLILTVDAEGYISTKDYLLNGLIKSEKRYAIPVDKAWYNDTQLMPNLPTDSTEDQTVTYEYDKLNREIASHQSNGKSTFTSYDNMGEIIAKGVRDGATTEISGDTYRANEFRFDAWGQIVAEASAKNSELLARIDADSTLKPEEKQQQKEKIWNKNTQRHVYDASGLKLSTAIRATPEASDQLTYFYYNAERQLIVSLQVIADKQIQIREYTRDTFNNVIKIREYSQIKAVLADKFNEPLTGGFLSESLRKALDTLQDDTLDVVTQKFYNKRDDVIKLIDAEGFETQQLPNTFSEITQTSLPVESKQPTLIIRRQYDVRGLETNTQRQADSLKTEVKRDYSNLYGKLTYLKDELKGDYQRGYDRKGRLIWTQNPLQYQRSYFVYDAWDKPLKITNTLGLTTQHLYNQSKRSETIIDSLGNQRTIIHNIFAEKIQEIDAKQQTQTWQHSADGQISRYTDSLGRGYTAVYNLLGNLTEKQTIKGSKTFYSYDAIGHLILKVQDVEGAKRQTRYQYNLLGQRIKTIDAKGIVQENKYDRRGLLIEECLDTQEKGLNLTIARQYNGQKQLLNEIQGDKTVADQYTRQLDYDSLNRHCQTIIDPLTTTRKDALNIQTRLHKNTQNSLLAEIDAKGYVTRFIIDSAGRRCFKINALGGVTEWKHNAADQIILERQYQQAITGNETTPLNDETTSDQLRAMLEPNAEDSLIYQFYDENGNQRFAVSCNGQQGYVKEKRYDALQQEIQTIQYATGIAIQDIEELTTEQLAVKMSKIANATQDRHHYFLRDEASQLRFSIDPQNYVREQRFDQQGRLICQISYANAVEDAEQFSQLPIKEVLAQIKLDENQDRYQMFYFDGLGQPLYTVNPEGQVIAYQHDANGNLIEEIQFNQRLKVPQDYGLLLKQLQSLKPDVTQDRITQKVYDAANRLLQHTDTLGYVESYQYDSLGNQTSYKDHQQSEWKTIFDRAKRPLVEITPAVNVTYVSQDASGRLTSTHETMPIEKHKIYDKVGNIMRIIAAANTTEPRLFEAEYNGLNQCQTTQLAEIAIDNGTALKPDDWRYRPETKQTLTTTYVSNAKGLKVAEQNAAGHWQFWVYDQQNRLVYYVKPLGVTIKKERDAFGKIQRKIAFATPCTLDLSSYTKTGIPKSLLDEYYQTRALQTDRIINYQRDQHGRVILQRQGPVYCYSADLQSGSSPGMPTLEMSEIKKTYNAWGQKIAQSEKVDALRHKEYFYWFDRNGLLLAEADNIGLDNQAPQYRCKSFENDSFGQRIKSVAYAKSLDISLIAHLSFTELKKALDKIASNQDRSDQFYYDKANHVVKKVRLQAVRQTLQLTDGFPTFNDASPQDLSICYQYNPNGQMIAKTLEDGSIEWTYYDQRGCKIAQTEVARDNHGLSNSIIPLTYYGNNAHGQSVLTTRFKQGAKPVKAGSIPEPVAVDPTDQQEQRLFDARGKLQWKQSNQQIAQGFSYTENGKLARQWWTLSNWQQKERNQYEKKVHLDEKYFQYDALNRAISVEVRRDTQTIETNCIVYDVFDQAIMEGEKPKQMHIYRRFDLLGRLWYSNAEKGVPVVSLHDLTGQCNLRMQSASEDLGIISYQGIPNLFNLGITDLELTANQRDIAGRILARSLPANYQMDTKQPEIIPLSILASNHFPSLGQVQSLSWPIPQERNAIAKFSLWPKDCPEQKQTLPILGAYDLKKLIFYSGVNVSALATDVYQYEVLFHFNDGVDPEKLLYSCSGVIQFEANNTLQSQHLVAITDREQPSLVRLIGNTKDLSRVELWQGLEKLATLDLQLDPKTHQYYVDLSRYNSGEYQLKPQKADKSSQDLSLAFTIYTDKPAIAPLSREISSTLQVSFLVNHVEINWQVPAFLQAQPVKLQCRYIDVQDKQQTYECELSPTTKRTTYTDKNGRKIQSNVSFAQAIKVIESISLAIQSPTQTVSSNVTRLKDHWLMLATTSDASSDEEDWEMIPAVASLMGTDEKYDWLPLYQNETPISPPFDPAIINQPRFKDKYSVMVTPVPNLKELKTPPILEYLDVSLDRMRYWKQFKTINLTAQGFIVDVSDFQAGVYPFRCNGHTGNLVISLDGQAFPTQDMGEPDQQRLVQPVRRYSYDLWNNKLTETDSLGHITQFIYNDADQVTQKIEALVDVVDEQGNTRALCPITKFAYNNRGLKIGIRDANGNTDGYILDAAGHKIIEVLSEGTHRKTQLFDALNNTVETRDAADQVTKYFYDQENNLLAFQKPSGSRRSFTYNELKQRNSDSDYANNTRRYNYDALGNLIERYEPLGQCTRMIYGRNHQQVKQINPDGSGLSWIRDPFGKAMQHHDLSGVVYLYRYDQKAQLLSVSSAGTQRAHSEYMQLFPSTITIDHKVVQGYFTLLSSIISQTLSYHYASGRITEINDSYTTHRSTPPDGHWLDGKKINYRYDSEGRRIAVRVISQRGVIQGEVLRETTSQIDALGREILTQDKQAIFTTAYDAVSNRRFIKGVVDVGGAHLTQEAWWKYDTEDRVIVSEGVLEKGEIKILAGKGLEFTYQNDRRVTESKLSDKKITSSLLYDMDGRLIGSKDDQGGNTERNYDNAGRQQRYKTTSFMNERVYNENSWLMATHTYKNAQLVNDTVYQAFTALGFPQQQTISYNDAAVNVDHLNCSYAGWDSWKIANIGGYRTNIYGRSDYSSVKNLLGPNGEPSSVIGAEDPEGRVKHFIATPEGLVLRRMHLVEVPHLPDTFYPGLETYYFYRINGQYLASYKKKENNFFDLALNWVNPQGTAGMEIGLSSEVTNHFSGLPEIYTCAAGDTYESIASNLYGDATLAGYIDAANGGGVLIAGQTLLIPPLMSVHNKASMALPYYQFLQIMQGSLMPHLDTPQPPQDDDDGFFGFLFKAVVIAVICVAVPALAPELVAGIAATIGVSQAVVTVVGVGLADAAAQGLCIGLGIQDHFSMTELAIIMITTGFGAQLPPLGADATAAELMEFVVRAGVVNVEEQLAEMAIGVRQQFDLAGVALAMGSAGLSPKIKLDNPLAQRMVSDIAVAGMTSVVRGRFEVENLAAQLLTDMASYVAHQQIKPISEDYHQSQKASRGAGQITQTTIDQQWESQLINDAEFTANTQLPSITFDVNNSYVSQQLSQRVGEEVSHFYHPTPPPRNPSGFWQRTWHSVEDVFEHRALIAEGRAAANSEVMSESLGRASANQQHYLDLGYTDSVAQYRAAELAAATEFPVMMPEVGISVMGGAATTELPFMIPETGAAIKLGKGLSQVSKLANRWGFFGHNEAEASGSLLFRTRPTSSALNEGVAPITKDLVNAMRSKGRSIDIASKGSDDYRYLSSMGAEGSTNTLTPNHILIREDASKSTLLEEFLHGTQNKLGIVDRLTPQGAEVHVKDFMIRHAKLLGLDNPTDLRLLEQLKREEIERLNMIYRQGY